MSQVLIPTTQKSIPSPLPDQPSAASAPIAEFIQETVALTRRLFLQLWRRPSTLIAGIVQPVMWLLIFGALFQYAPQGFLGGDLAYGQFLGAGVIVFTAFGGALNAGLPVMFDREFGFLNRLLVAPLTSRFSIVMASALFIMTLSLIQTIAIMTLSTFLGSGLPSVVAIALIVTILLLLVVGVTALSLGLAFALPGHVELIAVILVTNLPLLFASTALAPLSFMPTWLQVVVSLNPLSYAIEPIRYLYLHADWSFTSVVFQAPWGGMSLLGCLAVLLSFCAIALTSVQPLLRRTLG
ncbi:MAG: ABC transporter permease [Synechococcales bacterium]|nr:ABC transporter permease [Synechococcales bacterium]